MPKRSGRHAGGERRLEVALAALAETLTRGDIPWAVIGGIAVITHGVRRLTTDIDVVVKGGSVTIEEAMRVLSSGGFSARIADAEEFATTNLVLLLQHEATGVDVDLSFGWTDLEGRAIDQSQISSFGRVQAPMVDPAHLVSLKVIAGRARDIEDAAALLLLHRKIDVDAVRREVGEIATLADAPEIVDALDEALERAEAVGTTEPTESGSKRLRGRARRK